MFDRAPWCCAAQAGPTVTSHLLPTYARVNLAFERGEGAWLIATDGERYLDFSSGVAVNALGHAHPRLVAAVTEQAQKVWHVSNLYQVPEAERVATRLCEASFADVVFFCNSGAEAMECSIKMARKYHSVNGAPERYRTITFEGAFHGRTLATLAAGGQKKYLDGFGPVVEGFDQVPFADLDALKRAIGPATAAILIEPIMGEGGVRVVEPSFLRALRELCDLHGLLLVFDEVQTGMGRTGELFAYQRTGATPDIMALAKALGGGFPVGACLATSRSGEGDDHRDARLDLWRQSAGDERRQRRARRDVGAWVPRPGAPYRAVAQATARRDQGSLSLGHRRSARGGAPRRRARRRSGGRIG